MPEVEPVERDDLCPGQLVGVSAAHYPISGSKVRIVTRMRPILIDIFTRSPSDASVTHPNGRSNIPRHASARLLRSRFLPQPLRPLCSQRTP